MQKEIFGKICFSLRQDCFDPIKGRIWSQEDLATASNLSVRMIGQIERGEKVKLDEDVLRKLARTFKLTSIERQRFFDILNTKPQNNFDLDNPKEIIKDAQKARQPFLLHDGLYRIISMNTAFLKIYGLTTEYLNSIDNEDPTKYHIVRHIHDPESPIREVYKNQIETMELKNVIYWKYFSMPHRHTESFSNIQKVLFKKFPYFSFLWNSLNGKTSSIDITNLLRKYDSNHPSLGRLKYLGITIQLHAINHEVFMVTLLPTDNQTHIIFNNLDRQSNIVNCVA